MRLIYATEPVSHSDKSIFLAGPTPRDANVLSWRPQAIELLKSFGYEGDVYIPEPRDGIFSSEYEDQVSWEHSAIFVSKTILFWIPRDVENGMPAFTTNVEFGWLVGSSDNRVIYGRPESAEKCRYLDWMYRNFLDRGPYSDLETMIGDITSW
jgi:hypothetical protein